MLHPMITPKEAPDQAESKTVSLEHSCLTGVRRLWVTVSYAEQAFTALTMVLLTQLHVNPAVQEDATAPKELALAQYEKHVLKVISAQKKLIWSTTAH